MQTVVTPIDRYLAEQQASTAVERFARRHEHDLLEPGERWYTDRLPTATPGAGEQYAFRVDLDQCTGCKACVAGCHSLNGLDDAESWRSVGLLVGTDADRPVQQTVPTGCHHCVDPACLSGCPANAYEKDPFTGIVEHLDDQCIGCGYCELTCPYEVPKLNKRLGIVRKCDLCADRLADGEAPACVQACPTGAITITVVDTRETVAGTRTGGLLPGAPESSITAPTTQYVGARAEGDDLVAADHHAVHLSRSHPPLAFMLVLTQLSVGAFAAVLVTHWLGDGLPTAGAMGAALAGVVALGASVLHLGRPEVAWRAVLGLGHSWLSREIVAFGAYAPLAAAYAVAAAVDAPAPVIAAFGVAAAACGAIGVACSVLIYVVTERTWWAMRYTAPKFVGTAATVGPLFLATMLLAGGSTHAVAPLAVATLTGALLELSSEAAFVVPGRWPAGSDRARSAHLLVGPLRTATKSRFALGVLGGVVGPVAVIAAVASGDRASTAGPLALCLLALAGALAGELVERYQFFVASVAPRMPGAFQR